MYKRFLTISIIFLCAFLLCNCSFQKKIIMMESDVPLENEYLIALNEESIDGVMRDSKKHPTLFYWFAEHQKNVLGNLQSSHAGVALQVTIRCDIEGATLPKGIKFGFLYSSNFSRGENYENAVNHKPQVSFDFSMTQNSIVTVSMCVPKIGEDIVGFYVSGEAPFCLDKVEFCPAKIGWDTTAVVPVYSFGVNGGKVDFSNLSANFDGGKKVFDISNGTSSVLPKIEILLKSDEEAPITKDQNTVAFKYGSEEFSIRRSSSETRFTIQTSATKEAFSVMNFIKNAGLVKSVFMTANSSELCPGEDWIIDKPFVTDLGLIVEWPQSMWRIRTYELFQWEQFPNVLVFDFPTYKIQNEFFSRIAFFVEKKGYRGTLVDDDFIYSNHGYNAHDYGAYDLAKFFNEVHRKKVRLNNKEKMLCKILVANGIIYDNGDGTYSPGEGAVISMSKESSNSLRYQLLAHEAWHGIYFTNKNFRAYSDALYDSFAPLGLEFLKTYFTAYDSLQYDVDDNFLMRNEFMAYLLQQSPANTAKYFTTKSTWVKVNEENPEAAQYVSETEGSDFGIASQKLSDYVDKRWGYWGGRTHLVTRK